MTSNQVSVSNGHVTYQVSKHSLMAEPWDSGPTPNNLGAGSERYRDPPGSAVGAGGALFTSGLL